jgi:hypothetical protein
MEAPIKRRHVKTGGRKGAAVGSVHALKHGRKAAAALARRGQVMQLVKACREAVERARDA